MFEMAAPILSPAKCEVRSVIRFLNAKGERPAEIHRQIVTVYGDVMNRQNVTKWCREFSEGRTDVRDEQTSGRPSFMSDDLPQKTERELRANRRMTMRELHHIIPEVSKTTIHEAATEKLGYRKLWARWVPKMLTDDQETKRMGSAVKFLTRYAQEGDEFLDSTVTGDETLGFHHTPESKQQSLQWRHTHSPRTKKFKTSISVKKIMVSVFWDRKGILLVNFMPPGTTINAGAYCDTLAWLQQAIQNKRRGMLTRGVCLLHDNPRPHSAHITTALLEKFKWDVLDHLPYSLDLVPSKFHLILNLKKHLTGKKFDDDDEVQEEVMTWFNRQVAGFYDLGIQKLVPRLNKCLDNAGDYVENKGMYSQFIHSVAFVN